MASTIDKERLDKRPDISNNRIVARFEGIADGLLIRSEEAHVELTLQILEAMVQAKDFPLEPTKAIGTFLTDFDKGRIDIYTIEKDRRRIPMDLSLITEYWDKYDCTFILFDGVNSYPLNVTMTDLDRQDGMRELVEKIFTIDAHVQIVAEIAWALVRDKKAREAIEAFDVGNGSDDTLLFTVDRTDGTTVQVSLGLNDLIASTPGQTRRVREYLEILGEKAPEQPEDLDKAWKDRARWMLNLLAFHPNPAPETQQGKKERAFDLLDEEDRLLAEMKEEKFLDEINRARQAETAEDGEKIATNHEELS